MTASTKASPRPKTVRAGIVFVILCVAAALMFALALPRQHLAPRPRHRIDPSAAALGLLAALPNTEISFYDVDGADAAALRQAMDAAGPVDPRAHRRFDALSSWHVNWHWPSDGQGGCDVSRVALTFRASVRMPLLVHPLRLDADTADAWGRYITALAVHEAGHVRHAYDHIGAVAAAIRSAGCADANARGDAALDALARYDVDYDRETGHGATQGAAWPPASGWRYR